METSQNLCVCFNKQLDDLLSKLIMTFPNEDNFKDALNSLKMMRRIKGNKEIVKKFMDNISQYNDLIVEKNEAFFLNLEFGNDEISKIASRIKSLWNSHKMNKESKDNIWKYFQVLLFLGKQILKK